MRSLTIESVDRNYTKRFLGYKDNEVSEEISQLMDECEKELLSVVKAKYTYRIFDIKKGETEKIYLDGCEIAFPGRSIKRHLEGCEKAMMLAATTGLDVDFLIAKNQVNNMAKAVIIDAMAGVVVEATCDAAEDEVKARFEDYKLTGRFGLGYGDLPIKLSKSFLEVLKAPLKIGLCTTESFMLTPTKSVTCIIGMKRIKN